MPEPKRKRWADPHILGQNYTSGFERIPLAVEENLALLYHENSKNYAIETLPTQKAPEGWWPNRGMEIPLSKHLMPPDSEHVIRLPALDYPSFQGPPLGTLLGRRRSHRTFRDDPISLAQLTTLLGFAYGVTKRVPTPHGDMFLKAAPSNGARYPLELYAVVRKVDGLRAGVYHYRPEPHYLEFLREDDFAQKLEEGTLRQGIASVTPVTFILSAMWHRNMDKYGERGYRGILMETGAVIQNLYLTAESLSLGAIALEGIDEIWNELIGVDGSDETGLVCVSVGHPGPETKAFKPWE